MNILTDILSLIKRGKFTDVASNDDVIVLGMWNEKPEMTGVASPIPYKSVKLIKVKDLAKSENCDYTNVPVKPAGGTVGIYKGNVIDPITKKCTVSFRSLKSLSSNLTLAVSADDNYIEITTEGEPNLAANVGTGAGIWKNKIGETLNFKSLKSGNNISLTETADEITISATGGSGGGQVDSVVAGTNVTVDATDPVNPIVSASNTTYDLASAQDGANVDITLTGSDTVVDTVQLTAGTNITLTENAGAITIDAAGGGGGTMSSFTIDGDSGSPQTVNDGDTVTIEGGTAIDTVGTGGPKIVVNWNKSVALGYTKYVALLSQFAGNDPTQIILENNTGRILEWSWSQAGEFSGVWKDVNNTGTALPLVDIDKVTFTIAQHFKSGPSGALIVATSLANLKVQTISGQNNILSDSILDKTTIEIKIYN